MAEKIDLGDYIQKLNESLETLYKEIDLSEYKYKEETPKAYKTLMNGFKEKDFKSIERGLTDLYNYTNPDIEENKIKITYKSNKKALELFYEISHTVKEIADEISKAVAAAQPAQASA